MLIVELIGMSTAAACGREVKAKGYGSAIGKLARILIADGYAGHDIVRVMRGETICFKPARLEQWAEIDVSEGDGHSSRFVKHKPFEGDVWG